MRAVLLWRVWLHRIWMPAALMAVLLAFAARGQTAPGDFDKQGDVKRAAGDLDGAIADYSRAIELNPKDAAAYKNRGVEKAAKGDSDGAIADYSKAIELDPQDAKPLYNRGIANYIKGDFDGAIADYSKAIELDPKFAPAFNNRGTAKLARGDTDGAIADFSRAIDLDAKIAYAHKNRGTANFMRRNWKDSLADFRKENELAPEHRDYPSIFIWILRTRLGEKDAANLEFAAYLEQRGSGKPGDWPSTVGGFLLGKMSERDLVAAADSKDANTDHGQHCEAWFYAGMKQLLGGNTDAAAEDFKKCVATNMKSYSEYQCAEAELKALSK